MRSCRKAMVWLLPGIALLGAVSNAQGQSRRTLTGHVPPVVAKLSPIASYAPTNRLYLAIGLPLHNRPALDEFLRQLYDPQSTNFHNFLSTEQFTERFGPTAEDYQAVIQFGETNGFHVTDTLRSRLVVDMEATVGDVERAFQTTLRVYQDPSENRQFVAPDREPSVPANLPVADITGLSSFAQPRSLVRPTKRSAQPMSGSGPGGFYAGNDFRNAYAPGTALNGTGQKIGLLQFDGYNSSDIISYENTIGITNYVPLMNVLLDHYNGAAGSGNIEVCLDIETSISMAPGVSQIIVYEGNPSRQFFNPADVVSRMASDNLAKQLSSSWTWSGGPNSTVDAAFIQMAAQGQSFYQAAGDSDAYTGSQQLDNSSQVNSPVGNTNITTVGGTTLTMNGSGSSYNSEIVWNWSHFGGSDANVGSGGGASTYYAIPWYQQPLDMTTNLGSTTMRNVPDVALTADNVYVVYTSGSTTNTSGGVGGTSCAAPLWAGFTALVNQQSVTSSGTTVGFLNPAVYAIGTNANYTNCFHDITVGNNVGTNTPGLYPATTGYDLCTGWGTPNGTNLINTLAPRPYILTQPASQTVTSGNNVSFSVAVGGQAPFSYRWLLNGTNLPAGGNVSGTSSNVLTLSSVTTNNAGGYSVVVTNFSGSVTSSVATLTVNAAAPPPVASFVAAPTNGAVPLTVNFTNQSTGATNYSWNFGDGHTSATTNAVNTYTNAGSYSVTLTAIGPGGTNALTRTSYIVVTNVPPSISTSPQNLTVAVGSNATFTVTAAGTSPLSYQWRFNAVNITGATASSYTRTNAQLADAGNYTVVVTNVAGSITSAVAVLTVTSPPPVVAFVASVTNGMSPLVVNFTNLSSGATNYSWTFGDGHTNSAVSPTNTYTTQGSYTVTLVGFGLGGQTMLTRTNYIVLSNAPPVLAPINNRAVYVGATLLITNSATDPDTAQTLAFSLDVGAPSGASMTTNGLFSWTPDNSFVNTTNAITARVTDNGSPPLSDAKTFSVAVLPPPLLQSSALNTSTGGLFTLSWGAISGDTYRVEYSTNIAGTNWLALLPDVTATNSTASKSDSIQTDPARFYRVVVLP